MHIKSSDLHTITAPEEVKTKDEVKTGNEGEHAHPNPVLKRQEEEPPLSLDTGRRLWVFCPVPQDTAGEAFPTARRGAPSLQTGRDSSPLSQD